MPGPLSWWRVRGWVSSLSKVSPKLEQVLAGGLVSRGEHTLQGDAVGLEQHEELIAVTRSKLSGEKVQANKLTKVLKKTIETKIVISSSDIY